MIEEKNMTEHESLALISTMINKARNRFSEDGFLYILWGWVILICALTHFISSYYYSYDGAYMVWMLSYAVVIFQIIYLIRRRKKEKVRTYTDDIIGYVWITFAISTVLMVFVCVQFKAFNAMLPLLLVFYGIPIVLSGIILKFRALVIGGICCWILSFVSTFVRLEFHMLLIAVAISAGWLIPGYLLRIKYRKEVGVN